MFQIPDLTDKDLHGALPVIAKELSVIKPKFRYMEIGFRYGDSCKCVVEYAGHITIVDIFVKHCYGGEIDQEQGRKVVKEFFEKHNHPDYELFVGDSKVILPVLLKSKIEPYDLILVDADHSAEGAIKDLDNAEKLLAPNGSIVFDDINHKYHKYLLGVWNDWVAKRKDQYETKLSMTGNGVTIATRII